MGTASPPPWPAILLVGPTGSGKTPLGDELERRGLLGRRCAHFDFGAHLRQAGAEGGGEFGLSAAEVGAIRGSLASGSLFEDEDLPLIVKILRGFAEARHLGPGDLVVLNGLPRHPSQAEALEGLFAVERVVSLEADPAVILERIGRDTGRDRSGREDDDPGAVARRLEIFRTRTAPLLDHFRELHVPITAIRVAAAMTAAEMREELERRIGPAGQGGER